MENDTGAFRTKIRVKAAQSRPDQRTVGGGPAVPSRAPGSLMDALKQVRHASASDHPSGVTSATKRPSSSREAESAAAAEDQHRPKSSRVAKARVGRLAAAKLRQLQRLKTAAASLESLTRGEIEEATVEIIRRDGGKRPDHRRPASSTQER